MERTPDYILRCSYDFDGTLSRPDIQLYALYDVMTNKEVYILTKRGINENEPHGPQEVLEVANKIGIPFDRVIFTSGGRKVDYINQFDIQLHYDDEPDEVMDMRKNTNAIIRQV